MDHPTDCVDKKTQCRERAELAEKYSTVRATGFLLLMLGGLVVFLNTSENELSRITDSNR